MCGVLNPVHSYDFVDSQLMVVQCEKKEQQPNSFRSCSNSIAYHTAA